MVNPLDFIPKLSGFSPMPLGIMAPFMGYQSAALAYNFGLNYEFGKRVIKSMSNEKFNKIADDPIMLNELTARHHDVLLKAFINEVPKVDKIQDLILDKMVELERKKIEMMPRLIAQIPAGFLQGIFDLGNFDEPPPDNIDQPNLDKKKKLPPKPIPKKKSDSQLIQESFGKIRSGISRGHSVHSVWSHVSRTGNAWTDWTKISGLNKFQGNKPAAIAFGHQAWPKDKYETNQIGSETYYNLK